MYDVSTQIHMWTTTRPENGQLVTKTIKFVYICISAFVGVTFVNVVITISKLS